MIEIGTGEQLHNMYMALSTTGRDMSKWVSKLDDYLQDALCEFWKENDYVELYDEHFNG